ncbi:MAG: hypothetical protein FD131_5225 [Rhodocyclaceae bacterium]|nr:MAG: hypothetical protein FD131_5225 [Rhodocyclaceae bacterium]
MNTTSVVTREAIIQAIQQIARTERVEILSKSLFRSKSGISDRQVFRFFDSWQEVCKAAGLKPNLQNIRIEDGALFEEMRRVFLVCGNICTRRKFHKLSQYSVDAYRRFGKWRDVLLKFQDWLEQAKAEFPLVEQLRLATQTGVGGKVRLSSEPSQDQHVHWRSVGGTTYGSFLNFRGLQHAPINEQGVVFLFGMICFELGFMVEAVRTGYPDCEAKRRVHNSRDEWERVKIEFEYRSREFKVHGHDPKECDVIVCWEHNWPECPLEVVELKLEISKLNDKANSKVMSKVG